MATTVGGIRVRILGDDSDLQNKLRESTKQLAKYGAAATAAAGAAAIALTAQGLKAVDAQAKLARSLDTTIDSLRSLQLAAGDSGLDGMEGSLARLNRRLGAAEMGMGDAAKSVDALGLNLEELSAMDVDERLAAIADAIRDSGVSMQQAARHAQNLGFEQAEAAAFFMQGGDAIRAYRQEVQDLGLALTDIDAAKVEIANDAFSRMGLLTEGLAQQMAVQAAPFIEAISESITDTVKEMGGLGQIAEGTFDFIIDAAGFVADAIRGWEVVLAGAKVAFQGLGLVGVNIANSIVQSLDQAISGAREIINDLIRAANNIPGIDMAELATGESEFAAKMRGASEAMRDTFNESVADLHAMLMEPLPSESIDKWAKGVRERAEEVARATVEAQKEASQNVGGAGPSMTPEELAAQEAAKKRMEEQLETIRQSNMTELELLRAKFDEENAVINEALEQQHITREEWAQLSRDQKAREEEELTELERKAADARTKIAQQEAETKKKALGDALGSLTSLMNSESRKQFEIGKAAALASAIVDGYAAITGAYKVGASIGGPVLGAAYGAAAGLATLQNINAIKGASFGGGGGSAGAGSVTGDVSAQQAPIEQQRSVSIDIALAGADSRDRAVASSVIEQINDEVERGGRISRIALA